MESVLASIKPVVENTKHVRINESALVAFCASVTPAELEGTEFDEDTLIQGLTEEEYIAWSFVDSSLNFCYWGEPKWTIFLSGQSWDGSAAMIRSIKQALVNNYPLLDAQSSKT